MKNKLFWLFQVESISVFSNRCVIDRAIIAQNPDFVKEMVNMLLS